MNENNLPNFNNMSDMEIIGWFETLTTEFVLANLAQLAQLIRERLGSDFMISTATEQPPKLISVTLD